jgi:Flp pilus assembly protein TadG
MRHRRAARRGAAAAELALLLGFLAFLFVVAVDYCRVFACAQAVQNCALAGALAASGTAYRPAGVSAADAAQAAALAEGVSLNPPLQPCDVQVALDDATATVEVRYQFTPAVRFPGLPEAVNVTRAVRLPQAPSR